MRSTPSSRSSSSERRSWFSGRCSSWASSWRIVSRVRAEAGAGRQAAASASSATAHPRHLIRPPKGPLVALKRRAVRELARNRSFLVRASRDGSVDALDALVAIALQAPEADDRHAEQRARDALQRGEDLDVVAGRERQAVDQPAEQDRAGDGAQEGADDPAPEVVREEHGEVPDRKA